MKKLAKVNKQQNVNLFVYICINQNFNVEPPIVPYSTPTTYKYPESINIHQKIYVESTCIYIAFLERLALNIDNLATRERH